MLDVYSTSGAYASCTASGFTLALILARSGLIDAHDAHFTAKTILPAASKGKHLT
jgi:hypothetical protein